MTESRWQADGDHCEWCGDLAYTDVSYWEPEGSYDYKIKTLCLKHTIQFSNEKGIYDYA